MDQLINWIAQSGIHRWIAESPFWFPYPFMIALHSMGMGTIVGLSVAVDLRILGAASGLPLAPMASYFPVMWLGLAVNAITGVGLFINSPELLVNWDMWIKLIFLALALLTLRTIRAKVFGGSNPDKGPLPESARLLAGASIFFRAGTVVAGRMTAYLGS